MAWLSFLFCSSNKEDKSVIIQLPVFNKILSSSHSPWEDLHFAALRDWLCFSISPTHQNDRKITLPGKLIAKYNFWQRESFRQEELDPESDCAGLRDALQPRWMLPLPLIMGWRPQISANENFCPQHGLTSSQSLLVLGFSQVQRTKEERRGWWRARHRGSSGLGEKSPWKSQNGLGWEGPEGP